MVTFIHLNDDPIITFRRHPMQWTKPAFQDIRIGFEITMYFEAR
ncbi:pyrroloquinoline quinone precursor peptide PqqA [Psychrobacter sp. JB193]|nr:pyrroloquinoline quinone precursor peptide PqqA [Psychrobacter sp. JB193]